jgi:hypothetical protein
MRMQTPALSFRRCKVTVHFHNTKEKLLTFFAFSFKNANFSIFPLLIQIFYYEKRYFINKNYAHPLILLAFPNILLLVKKRLKKMFQKDKYVIFEHFLLEKPHNVFINSLKKNIHFHNTEAPF